MRKAMVLIFLSFLPLLTMACMSRSATTALATRTPIVLAPAEPETPTPAATPLGYVLVPENLSAGEPYSPELGNGGYDVQTYTLKLAVDPATTVIDGEVLVETRSTMDNSPLLLRFSHFIVIMPPCDQNSPSLVLLDRAPRRKEIDADAVFNALFNSYEQPLCSYLARLTGSTAQAQELAQETFIRAYRALLRGEEWDNPRAWLYRAASRLAIDDYRRRRLLQWLPLSERDPDPGPGVERADDRSTVQAALEALPLQYRIPLVLYSCEEYSVAEVAETLGLSLSAVKMRLSRAREMFRQAYRPEEEAPCRSPRPVEGP